MQLSEYGHSLAVDVAFWLEGLQDPQYTFAGLGKLSLELTEKLQAMAILSLFCQGDVTLFKEQLGRSANARITYLRRVHDEQQLEDHHFVAARYAGLLSALVAGDANRIQEIVKLTPQEFRPRREYKDDFCFARLLGTFAAQLHLGESVDANEQRRLLADYEKYLDGEADARFDLCRCFIDVNEAGFTEALELLLEDHEATVDRQKQSGMLLEIAPVALQKISLIGLAAIGFAKRLNWRIDQEYKFCPKVAQLHHSYSP